MPLEWVEVCKSATSKPVSSFSLSTFTMPFIWEGRKRETSAAHRKILPGKFGCNIFPCGVGCQLLRVLQINCKAQIKDCAPQRCTPLEMLAIWNRVWPGENTNNFLDTQSHLVKFVRLLLRTFCLFMFLHLRNYHLGIVEIYRLLREKFFYILWGLFFVQMQPMRFVICDT